MQCRTDCAPCGNGCVHALCCASAQKKGPPEAALFARVFDAADQPRTIFTRRRRLVTTTPNIAKPASAREPGSGTPVVEQDAPLPPPAPVPVVPPDKVPAQVSAVKVLILNESLPAVRPPDAAPK